MVRNKILKGKTNETNQTIDKIYVNVARPL